MRKSSLWLWALSLASISVKAPLASAQVQVVGPGSTVAGDTLRGEGVYLQGLGWYELNDAKAMAINAETSKKLYDWNKQIYADYRREYNDAVNREMTKRRMNDAAKKKFLEEREARLRTNPTPEDIQKGDALNALLTDLSSPMIQESSWRGSKVPLPDDISIKSLAFQFAPKSGAKENTALTKGLIALGRLDIKGRWPDVFPMAKLNVEIPAYEAGYHKVVDQSLAGRLELEAVLQMDDSLKALRNKVGVIVPSNRGFRAEALRFVDDLSAATKMFDASTLPFAREMVADTNKHEAHTVGELLAFMRKYRLKFATANASPGGEEMYARLYGLLRQQAEALGLKPEQGLSESNIPVDSVAFGRSSYKVYREELTWHQAEAKCREMGGHLVKITSETENRFLTTQIKNAGLEIAWLGATDERVEGRWIWTDNSEMRFNQWDRLANQPNNKNTGEHYLALIVLRDGKWSDQPNRTEDKYHPGFVCQWDSVKVGAPSRNDISGENFQAGTVWSKADTHVLTVLRREGSFFRANFNLYNGNIVREVTGTVQGSTIRWMGKDDFAIKGEKGGDNIGVIQGD